MFYKKRISVAAPKSKATAIKFTGEINRVIDRASLPQSVAINCYNCNGNNGSLTHNGGFEKFCQKINGADCYITPPAGAKFLDGWYYKRWDNEYQVNDDRYVFLLDDGTLCSFGVHDISVKLSHIQGAELSGAISGECYRLADSDVLILSGENSVLTVVDGNKAYAVSGAPAASSMCVHYERLFVTADNALWFSDDLDPTNWNVSLDQAGYIQFADNKGAPLKAVSYQDYLYLFREYGITRIAAYAEQESFTVTEVCSLASRIIASTVAVCGENILFLTEEGLYTFDGVTASRLLPHLDGVWQSSPDASAAFCKGRYMLSCNINYDDGEKVMSEWEGASNNTFLTYRLDDGELKIVRGCGVRKIIPTFNRQSDALMLFEDSICLDAGQMCQTNTFFETPMQSCYVFPKTDLGFPDREKLIEKIVLECEDEVTLEVNLDGKTFCYDLRGSEKAQKVIIKERAELFELVVRSQSCSFKVRPLLLYFNVR